MLPKVRAEGKGDSARNSPKEAQGKMCEPMDKNRIERLKSPGELARHNKIQSLRRQGKFGGGARTVHVLIPLKGVLKRVRGDLSGMRQVGRVSAITVGHF
ncbi:MAG: hypothetical protein A4E62_00163 [Syntrophorhabdus sp. PtaU1.Bin002]|nr:MAG: hypothetical protein A4E58_00318 [Syntrophorhabdus sp. PtaB.Bin006]OPY73896.1 MAG: hypothetical protein A4E62_00163 [Syntrophorhabdus sp. PtaU1.Bin002]